MPTIQGRGRNGGRKNGYFAVHTMQVCFPTDQDLTIQAASLQTKGAPPWLLNGTIADMERIIATLWEHLRLGTAVTTIVPETNMTGLGRNGQFPVRLVEMTITATGFVQIGFYSKQRGILPPLLLAGGTVDMLRVLEQILEPLWDRKTTTMNIAA